MSLTKDKLVESYIAIRDRIAARKAAFDAEDGKDKELLRKIELVLMQRMDQDKEESFKTAAGTAFIQVNDFAGVADWDALKDFVLANEAFDFLEKRVAKTAVREYVKANNQLPPGVNYGTKREVMVRRPSRKTNEVVSIGDAHEQQEG